MTSDLFLGLDLGAAGARAVLADAAGALVADAFSPLPPEAVWRGGNGEHEQDPQGWWTAARHAIDRAVAVARGSGLPPERIRAMAVSATSGTLALVDGAGMPVGRALMHDDPRGGDLAGELNRAGEELVAKMGVRFNASFGLVKIAYLATRDPGRLEQAARVVHAADFIAARLTGRYGVTDWTSALKTGFDAVDGCWPAFLGTSLNVPREKLPDVLRPGELIGNAEAAGAHEAGLAPSTLVVAGMTDGCAAQLGAGAVSPGAACASLGTTLTLRGVTRDLRRDPKGRVHSDRHPEGFWLPAGSSRTGGGALEREFAWSAIPLLDERVASRLPTKGLVYPLLGRGERFPIVRNDLETWWIEPVEDKTERFGAMLEGAAYVERMGYEVLRGLGVDIEGPIRTHGGGTQSAPWLAVRASVLNRPLEVPAHGSAAFGMAVLAAAHATRRSLEQAAAAMVRVRTRVEPRADWVAAYEERYRRFEAALKSRGG